MSYKSKSDKSHYKRLGDYIELVKEKNKEGLYDDLRGINIDKFFMPSVANVVGVDLTKYKIIKKNQFACNRMHVGRDYRIPIALSKEDTPFIVSPAYDVFEIIDNQILLEDYLMMWFSRKEFDRNAWYYTDADVRGGLAWNAFCNIKLPIPSIEKQRQIVSEYNAVNNRIRINEQLNQKLEETAQAIYKHWFVDFEFPNENGQPYKSSGGKLVYNEELDKEIPEGWEVKSLSEISKITMGQSPKGESYNEIGKGEIFYQGRTDFGFRIPSVRIYTTSPKRKAKKGDILMSVRAPVGDLNIADTNCCIGRGLASINSKTNSYIFYTLMNFKSKFDSDKGTGTIFSSINKTELFCLKILNNKNIALLFDDLVKKYDEQIIIRSKQNKELQELKNLLLSKMSKVEVEKELA